MAEPLGAWAGFIEARFNAGAYQHGVIAWCLAVLPPVLLVGGLYALLYSLNPLLAWALNVAVLYLTMGFRQFSHHYTEIQLALRLGDLDRARQLLAEWLGLDLRHGVGGHCPPCHRRGTGCIASACLCRSALVRYFARTLRRLAVSHGSSHA